jgi:hypothetical protein
VPASARSVLLSVPLGDIQAPVGLDQQVLLICQAQPIAQAWVNLWQLLCIDLWASTHNTKYMRFQATSLSTD